MVTAGLKRHIEPASTLRRIEQFVSESSFGRIALSHLNCLNIDFDNSIGSCLYNQLESGKTCNNSR